MRTLERREANPEGRVERAELWLAVSASTSSAPRQREPRFGLTLTQVCIFLPPLLLMSCGMRQTIAPQDFWWHLEVGRITLETGSIPVVDLFSFTRAGEPWLNQAWLMQVGLYFIHRVAGLSGVLLFHGLAISAGYIALAIVLARRYGWFAAWAGVLVAFLVGVFHQGVRPQLISFPLFGVLCAAIELHRAGHPRPLRWTPLLFAVWVNAHGGFVFGLGALGLYWVGHAWPWVRGKRDEASTRQLLQLSAICLGCGLALTLNPGGPLGMIEYVQGFFASPITMAGNQEFQPLSIRSIDGLTFAIGLLSLSLALRGGPRLSLDQGLALLVFGVASLYIRRIAPWFGFLLAPVLAAAVAHHTASEVTRARRTRRASLYVGLGALFLISSLPWLRPYVPGSRPYLFERNSPADATRALCDVAPAGARVFAAEEFASYLIFHCKGRRIFIDSRIELYPSQIWSDYFAAVEGRFDWERLLDRYDVEWLMLHRPPARSGSPADESPERPDLIDAAAESPAWTEVYRDEQAVLFRRDALAAPDARYLTPVAPRSTPDSSTHLDPLDRVARGSGEVRKESSRPLDRVAQSQLLMSVRFDQK